MNLGSEIHINGIAVGSTLSSLAAGLNTLPSATDLSDLETKLNPSTLTSAGGFGLSTAAQVAGLKSSLDTMSTAQSTAAASAVTTSSLSTALSGLATTSDVTAATAPLATTAQVASNKNSVDTLLSNLAVAGNTLIEFVAAIRFEEDDGSAATVTQADLDLYAAFKTQLEQMDGAKFNVSASVGDEFVIEVVRIANQAVALPYYRTLYNVFAAAPLPTKAKYKARMVVSHDAASTQTFYESTAFGSGAWDGLTSAAQAIATAGAPESAFADPSSRTADEAKAHFEALTPSAFLGGGLIYRSS